MPIAGVRVLPGGAAETARAPRETLLSRGRLGMLSVAGAASYGTLADEVVASGPLEPLADGVTEVAAQ